MQNTPVCYKLFREMAAQACYKSNVFDSLPYMHICIYVHKHAHAHVYLIYTYICIHVHAYLIICGYNVWLQGTELQLDVHVEFSARLRQAQRGNLVEDVACSIP